MKDEAPKKSAARELLDYEQEVSTALKRFYNRTHWEPATDETPLSELLASEDEQLDEWAVKRETARAILLWLAADGPHPAMLLRRLYLMGDHMMIPPYCQLTLREKGALANESHGAPHWLMKRIITDPLVRAGAVSVKSPGQKGRAASAAAARAQQGNGNRKGSVTGDAGRREGGKGRKRDAETAARGGKNQPTRPGSRRGKTQKTDQ